MLLRKTGWVEQVARMKYDNWNFVEKLQETLRLGWLKEGVRIILKWTLFTFGYVTWTHLTLWRVQYYVLVTEVINFHYQQNEREFPMRLATHSFDSFGNKIVKHWKGICCGSVNKVLNLISPVYYVLSYLNVQEVEGGARNVIPLIVHITHFYYYKSIWHLVQN